MNFLDEYERILREQEKLTPEVACEILRKRWGGSSVYIGVRERIVVEPHDTHKSLVRKGMHPRTAYRRLRKNWANSWK